MTHQSWFEEEIERLQRHMERLDRLIEKLRERAEGFDFEKGRKKNGRENSTAGLANRNSDID